MGETFQFRVGDMFRLGSRAVFAGTVESGSVALGQRVVVRSPAGAVLGRVVGIEQNKQQLSRALKGSAVALGIKLASVQAIADGFAVTSAGVHRVVSLQVGAPQRVWWQFWRPWV